MIYFLLLLSWYTLVSASRVCIHKWIILKYYKMFPTSQLLTAISNMPATKKLKVAVKTSVKSGMLVGAATTACGIVAGPIGLALGGITSSFAAYYCAKGNYESVVKILLHDTSPQEKEKLAGLLRSCFTSRNIMSMQSLLTTLQFDEELKQIIIQIITSFLVSEMGRQVLPQ